MYQADSLHEPVPDAPEPKRLQRQDDAKHKRASKVQNAEIKHNETCKANQVQDYRHCHNASCVVLNDMQHHDCRESAGQNQPQLQHQDLCSSSLPQSSSTLRERCSRIRKTHALAVELCYCTTSFLYTSRHGPEVVQASLRRIQCGEQDPAIVLEHATLLPWSLQHWSFACLCQGMHQVHFRQALVLTLRLHFRPVSILACDSSGI
mmetsp:Transcript_14227/g.32291  ORF Transcript_14227/g.32291 Transcript_14227/m.32291 type:complete len:206 (-) Transcript_14227:976-1593(-)